MNTHMQQTDRLANITEEKVCPLSKYLNDAMLSVRGHRGPEPSSRQRSRNQALIWAESVVRLQASKSNDKESRRHLGARYLSYADCESLRDKDPSQQDNGYTNLVVSCSCVFEDNALGPAVSLRSS
eukprot:768663-Hanusia_phi.AAC.3